MDNSTAGEKCEVCPMCRKASGGCRLMDTVPVQKQPPSIHHPSHPLPSCKWLLHGCQHKNAHLHSLYGNIQLCFVLFTLRAGYSVKTAQYIETKCFVERSVLMLSKSDRNKNLSSFQYSELTTEFTNFNRNHQASVNNLQK